MKNKKIWIGIAVVVVMVALIGVAISKKPKTEQTIGGFKSGPRVKVETVKVDNIQTKISASGQLEAEHTKTIYAETSNKVVSIYKKKGDTVKKGEIILTLDEAIEVKTEKQIETLETQLKAAQDGLNQILSGGTKQEILNAQSAILKAEVDEQNAKDTLDSKQTALENLQRDLKTQELEYAVQEESFGQGLIAQKELDDSKNLLTKLQQDIDSTKVAIAATNKSLETIALQKETATYNLNILLNKIEDPTKRQSISAKQAEIKNLQTQIFNSTTDLGNIATEIVASIDGVITSVPEKEGMPIAAGSVIVEIVDPSSLIINTQISPYYAADLKEGLEAIVKYTGSKTVEVDGKVSKVSPIALTQISADKSANTTIPVEVKVLAPGNVIKPGFTVDVKIITETRENVFVVPLLATVEDDDDNTYLYVVGEDGTLEKRYVQQGLSNGLYIEVSDVKEGEIIVSSPAEFLNEGTKISYEKTGDMK